MAKCPTQLGPDGWIVQQVSNVMATTLLLSALQPKLQTIALPRIAMLQSRTEMLLRGVVRTQILAATTAALQVATLSKRVLTRAAPAATRTRICERPALNLVVK